MTLAAGLILDAHTAKLGGLAGWSGAVVVEGPLLGQSTPTKYVTLGYVPTDDSTIAFVPVPDAQNGEREPGSIGCYLSVSGKDVPTARAAALAMIASWAQWLTSDRTMGTWSAAQGAPHLLSDSEAHLEVDVALGLNRASGGIVAARVAIVYTAHTYG